MLIVTIRMAKDARYNERERERSPHYRPVRDDRDRRAMPDHKGDVRSSREHRYPDPTKGNIGNGDLSYYLLG